MNPMQRPRAQTVLFMRRPTKPDGNGYGVSKMTLVLVLGLGASLMVRPVLGPSVSSKALGAPTFQLFWEAPPPQVASKVLIQEPSK